MNLINLSLQRFRNIKELEFTPENGVNVIYGANGQGKTNLLESIFILTGAKSFRARKDNEMIMQGEVSSVIDGIFNLEQREQRIRVTISDRGRIGQRNRGTPIKAAALAGVFCCVLFSPEHLMLVKGSPEQRRKFIDTALCQISPHYLIELRRYTRLLGQKNSALKDSYRNVQMYDILDVFDVQIAEAARVITQMRSNFCDSLLVLAKEHYSAISGDSEQLSLAYISTLFDDGFNIEQAVALLHSKRQYDIGAGFSTLGPHRDDITITLDGVNARVYASQGQQRTVVLALKMAEASIMERSLGEEPILLLDDVLSELDGNRQEYLINRLATQSIITGCDPSLVTKRVEASLFKIDKGILVE
ncbi:MAG: DNA replication/repair protein RecF [Oscillospiraceae bacterium]|nr:DNA replication/repair protein RecF [Oscillospiraceae bacterium]